MLSTILTTALLATAASASHGQPKRASEHALQMERSLNEIVSLGNSNQAELERRTSKCPADHANWEVRNGPAWWKTDPTQQDHARYHALLSMSAYGDYAALCPKTFVGNFTLVDEFSASGSPLGQTGYAAKIPSMNKVVLVFAGNSMDEIDWTEESIEDIVDDCTGCTAAKGVKELYQLASKATNNFATFKAAVASTGLLASVTGHGVGGAVAVLAGLDLGSKGNLRYAHNQGMPRAFNYESIYRYDRIFEGEAGQSLINRNDYAATYNAVGDPYCHVGQKAHITGDVDQWFTNCYGWNENTTCLGSGASKTDHTYYFADLGTCGSVNKGF